jgi:hypothetical protein
MEKNGGPYLHATGDHAGQARFGPSGKHGRRRDWLKPPIAYAPGKYWCIALSDQSRLEAEFCGHMQELGHGSLIWANHCQRFALQFSNPLSM